MKVQAVLFDLDGTLTDPKEGICRSVQYALASFGIVEENLDVLEPFIGPPLKDSFQQFYDLSDEDAMKAIVKYRERFAKKGVFENYIYDGIKELLEALKEKNYLLAVATSKPQPFAEQILKYFSIDGYFDVVVGSMLDGRRGTKEEVVEEALVQLKSIKSLKESDMVMVGDRKFDVEGAKKYGLHSIGVAYGYAQPGELEEAGAEIIAGSVEELKKILCD